MTTPSLKTALTEVLGIELPVAQAGMGGFTTPELVAAVSNAGGLGILAASSLPVPQLRAAIARIRELTDKLFGVNTLIAPPESGASDAGPLQHQLNALRAELGLDPMTGELEMPPSTAADEVRAIIDEGVPVLSLGLGDPGPYIEQARERGVKVMVMVATVEEAVIAAERGADIIVAQGAEAGGHRSNFRYPPGSDYPAIGTFALVPQVIDAVDQPVLAAGGIMDGRGLAAALALGAAGVLCGTRFLMAEESAAFPAYRDAIAQASAAEIVISDATTGRPSRTVRNRLLDELGRASLPYPLQAAAAFDIYLAAYEQNRADLFPLWAGQGAPIATEVQPAAAIVAEMVAEARAVFDRFCR